MNIIKKLLVICSILSVCMLDAAGKTKVNKRTPLRTVAARRAAKQIARTRIASKPKKRPVTRARANAHKRPTVKQAGRTVARPTSLKLPSSPRLRRTSLRAGTTTARLRKRRPTSSRVNTPVSTHTQPPAPQQVTVQPAIAPALPVIIPTSVVPMVQPAALSKKIELSWTVIHEKAPQQVGAACAYEAANNAMRKRAAMVGAPNPTFSVQKQGAKDFINALRQTRRDTLQQIIAEHGALLKTLREGLVDKSLEKSHVGIIQCKKNITDAARELRQIPGDGDWLDDRELQLILTQHTDLKPDEYTIIPNIDQLNPQHIALSGIMRALRTQPGFSHIFFVGNMRFMVNNDPAVSLQQAVRGTRGHWIALVAHNVNNEIIYYVFDSLNPGKSNAAAQTCIDFLQQASLEQLEFDEMKDILFDDARRALSNQNYPVCLQNIQRFINIAIAARKLHAVDMHDHLEDIKTMLTAIESADATHKRAIADIRNSIAMNQPVHVGFLQRAVETLIG